MGHRPARHNPTHKIWAVDYWSDPNDTGEPDRSDYSGDRGLPLPVLG